MTRPEREILVECPECLRRFFVPESQAPVVPEHAVEGEECAGSNEPGIVVRD